MARSVKVAVIGAGVSGLVAARELQREGHRVVIFEKSHRIGGTWSYDPRTESDPLGIDPDREIIHSSLYLSMRTNLPRKVMGYLDYPFVKRETGDPRTFPGHEEVLRFLDGFEEEFGILESTRFESEVVRVELVGERKEEGWVVEWRSRGSESLTRETFEAVVVCSGHFTAPKLANIRVLRTGGDTKCIATIIGYPIHLMGSEVDMKTGKMRCEKLDKRSIEGIFGIIFCIPPKNPILEGCKIRGGKGLGS